MALDNNAIISGITWIGESSVLYVHNSSKIWQANLMEFSQDLIFSEHWIPCQPWFLGGSPLANKGDNL